MKAPVRCVQCGREYTFEGRRELPHVGGGVSGVTIDGVEYQTSADEKRKCGCGTILMFITHEAPEA